MAFHALRIARIVPETSDARSIVLDVPAELASAFRYRAGQFLTFELTVNGQRLVRCYSLASSPDVDPSHKVTVKRVAGGRASNWMNDVPREGDVLRVMAPSGVFVLRDDPAPLLLFAGGSGITPVISLVKSALATSTRRLQLVYANRDRGSIIFHAEIDALAAKHADRLHVVHRLDVEHGFLTSAVARDLVTRVEGWKDAHVYVCGPGPFMDVVETTVLGLGIPADRLFIERFISVDDPSEGEADRAEAARVAATKGHPDEVVVLLDGKTTRVPYSAGDTILQAARRAGLEPPFACEDGYCGSCAAKLVRGEVTMRKNEVFNRREVAEGNVLTCQARCTSAECEVRYDP